MSHKETPDWLSRIPLLRGASDAFIKSLPAQSHTRNLSKGQMLFLSDDPAEYFFIITKGWIKLFRETLDGSQAIIDIVPAGHMIGETSIFHEGRYPFSAEATENMQLISLPLSALKTEIETNPQMALAMLGTMAQHRKQQEQEIEHRTLQNAPQRIGCFLLRLIDQTKTDAPVTINLPYDKVLVASRLGMQPETFSRALSKLKAETGITVKGATVTCNNVHKLSTYSCITCSSEFPCRDMASGKR